MGRIPSINCSVFTVFISQFIVYVSQLEFLPQIIDSVGLGTGPNYIIHPKSLIELGLGRVPSPNRNYCIIHPKSLIQLGLGRVPSPNRNYFIIHPKSLFQLSLGRVPRPKPLHYPSQVIDRLGLGRVPTVFSPRVGFSPCYSWVRPNSSQVSVGICPNYFRDSIPSAALS